MPKRSKSSAAAAERVATKKGRAAPRNVARRIRDEPGPVCLTLKGPVREKLRALSEHTGLTQTHLIELMIEYLSVRWGAAGEEARSKAKGTGDVTEIVELAVDESTYEGTGLGALRRIIDTQDTPSVAPPSTTD